MSSQLNDLAGFENYEKKAKPTGEIVPLVTAWRLVSFHNLMVLGGIVFSIQHIFDIFRKLTFGSTIKNGILLPIANHG